MQQKKHSSASLLEPKRLPEYDRWQNLLQNFVATVWGRQG
jgi:hypothetical protein